MFRLRCNLAVACRAVVSVAAIHKLDCISESAADAKAPFTSSSATYPANNPIEDRHISGVYGKYQVGAVLDGHGGWQVSQFASQKLVPTVLSHLETVAGAAALGREEVSGRIVKSFHALDQAYIDSIRAAYERGFGEVAKVGSCVCLALVRDDGEGSGTSARRELVVANAGDCRAVLATFDPECAARVSSSEGRAVAAGSPFTGAGPAVRGPKSLVGIQLTHDHNAREPHEQEVLCREHPGEGLAQLVRCKSAAACYVKGRLQLTRSLGDLYLKSADFNAPPGLHRSAGRRIPEPYSPPYVSATPEVTFCNLDGRDKFVVLASDGVWDYMSPQEAVDTVQSFLRGYAARGVGITDRGVSDGASEWDSLAALLGLRSKEEVRLIPTGAKADPLKQYAALFEEAYVHLDSLKAKQSAEERRASIQDLTANILVEVTLRKAAAEAGMSIAELKALPIGTPRRHNHDDTTVVVLYL